VCVWDLHLGMEGSRRLCLGYVRGNKETQRAQNSVIPQAWGRHQSVLPPVLQRLPVLILLWPKECLGNPFIPIFMSFSLI
jgi:hypothetical protein